MANKPPADATIKRAPHSKDNPYYLASRATAQDARISYQALGLLTHLLSLPDDWEVRVKALARKVKKNGRDFVYSAIKELCDAGYMTPRSKYRNEKGQWVWSPYYVHETPVERPQTAQPDTGQPDTVQPDTAEAEIKTTEDTGTAYIQTEDVVVVPENAAESTGIPLNAELPQPKPADVLREGKDTEQPLKDLSHPVPQHPLSQTAEALVTTLGKANVTRLLASELIDTYGEDRVRAVWQYVQDNTDTLRKPVAFLRSELADPRYVPLNSALPDVVTESPANDPTDIDEAEIETQADTPVVDASVATFVRDKTTAADIWQTVADQLVLKGFREIKGAPLVAYDADGQAYTVQVASAHLLQMTTRYHKIVHSTLVGLHAGASVVFIVRVPAV